MLQVQSAAQEGSPQLAAQRQPKNQPRSAKSACGRLPFTLCAHVNQKQRSSGTDARYCFAAVAYVQDFILSILEANPSARDSRFYLKAFAPPPERMLPDKGKSKSTLQDAPSSSPALNDVDKIASGQKDRHQQETETSLITEQESLLDHEHQHTGIVKVQGPFTDRQLASIAEGLVYLRRLGLVPIILVDLDNWSPNEARAKDRMRQEVLRITDALEAVGGVARPMLEPLLRIREDPEETSPAWTRFELDSKISLRSALEAGEMPVIPPFAIHAQSQRNTTCAANDYMRGLAAALAKSAESQDTSLSDRNQMDLTPLRLMVINREGGIPSHARGGTPHLSINLESEFDHIRETFIWDESHPTALPTLSALRDALEVLPRTSSAVVVSHRSSKALIANLVTNKPAHSPSLHHSALPSPSRLQSTPTVIRYGLPIRVIRSLQDVNLMSLTALLEKSFRRQLDIEAYYGRLGERLDFMVVAGDCAAVAIVTKEGPQRDLIYLDKFAVLPELQGDGTVDFLWGALRDESFGLGLLDALNNNGGLEGRGSPVDLVWRSRADNPVNKWYFERSSGFAKLAEMGKGGVPGALFWCDAEKRVIQEEERSPGKTAPFITESESGRLQRWSEICGAIPR